MNGEAAELRQLAQAIEQMASQSRAYSMVANQVHQLCDYLCLRARVMELSNQLEQRRASKPELSGSGKPLKTLHLSDW